MHCLLTHLTLMEPTQWRMLHHAEDAGSIFESGCWRFSFVFVFGTGFLTYLTPRVSITVWGIKHTPAVDGGAFDGFNYVHTLLL